MARVAVVTCGTRGIGEAISLALKEQGRTVIAKGSQLSDEQILRMNWLAEGVQGRIAR